MKRLIATIMLALPISAMASIPEFTKIVEQYQNTEGVTAMTMTKDMLSIYGGSADNAYIEHIDSIDLIMCDNSTLFTDIVEQCNTIADKYNAETLISLQEQEMQINVYAINSGGQISDIMLIINGDESVAAIISGDIAAEQLGDLIKVAM